MERRDSVRSEGLHRLRAPGLQNSGCSPERLFWPATATRDHADGDQVGGVSRRMTVRQALQEPGGTERVAHALTASHDRVRDADLMHRPEYAVNPPRPQRHQRWFNVFFIWVMN